jgi:hypothetical protein
MGRKRIQLAYLLALTLCASPALAARVSSGGGSGSAGLSTVLTIDRIDGEANSLAQSFRIGASSTNRYWALYDDATSGLQWVCVVADVANACNYIRKLASSKYWEIQNSAGTSILRVSEDGSITNMTLDVEGTGNTITVTEEKWWDVVAVQAGAAAHIWNTPSSNAPAATVDPDSTNTIKGYAAFDATTDESFEMNWVLPTGFTGAIDVHFIWKAAATSGAVGWCAQLIRVADGSTSDPAYPAQASGNCVSDTAKGTTLQENHATISGVTCTSCTARDHVYVRISRDANGGAVTDDMTGDAHLMKVGRTWRVAK